MFSKSVFYFHWRHQRRCMALHHTWNRSSPKPKKVNNITLLLCAMSFLFIILRVSLYGVLYSWIHERARCRESCVLIGYPSGQDKPILSTRDVPRWSRKKNFSFWLYNKSFIDQAGWRWLYIGLVFSLGSLSSDVFDSRASTGSGLFALLSRDFEQNFGQVVSKRVNTLSNTNLVASRHTEREKGSHPVDMHHSKMSLLKLPIDRDEAWPMSSHLTATSPKVQCDLL